MIFTLLLTFGLALFAFLAWRDLKLAMLVMLGLLPSYLVRFSMGGLPTTMLEGMMVIVIGVSLIRAIRSPLLLPSSTSSEGRVCGELQSCWFWLGVLFVASLVAVVVAPNHLAALGIWRAYFLEPAMVGVIIYKIFDRKDYEKALSVLSISGAVIGALAMMQVAFLVGVPDAWAIENRATSIFPFPNAVGLFLAPIVTAMILRTFNQLYQHKYQSLALNVSAIILMLGGIVVAKTEAALVAVPVAIFVVMVMTPRLSVKVKSMMIGLAGLSIIILLMLPSIASKLTLHDQSGLVRRSQWSETIKMLSDKPMVGAGLSGYPTALAPYHSDTDYEIFQYPHNIFLNVWSELGLVGLIGIIGLMITTSMYAWKNRDDDWVLICFTVLVGMTVHGLVDVPFFKNDLAVLTVFWLVALFSRRGGG